KSTCRLPKPCRAEVGKAWWLLCQASPNVKGESHARLRDSSFVAYGLRPKKWQRELMQNVNWWHRKIRTAPPQSIAVSPPSTDPVRATPSPNGSARPA